MLQFAAGGCGKSKPYQVKQVGQVILKYRLGGRERDGRPRSRYEVILYWSEEDGVYVAEVPELAGCQLTADPIKTHWRMGSRNSRVDRH